MELGVLRSKDKRRNMLLFQEEKVAEREVNKKRNSEKEKEEERKEREVIQKGGNRG